MAILRRTSRNTTSARLPIISCLAVFFAVCGQGPLDAAGPAEQPEDQPRPPAASENEEVGQGGYFPGVDPLRLEPIRDDATFRADEHDAWFHLADILNKTGQTSLEQASAGRVTGDQLFKQSKQYRGKLVTVRGKIRRIHHVQTPKNDRNIGETYQTCVFTSADPDSLVVVYCLELPEDSSGELKGPKEAEITGFYFKRLTYRTQDTLRIAPVLLAKTFGWLKQPLDAEKPPPEDQPDKPAEDRPAEPAMITGPRDLLRRARIDDSHFARLIDGRPVNQDENETLLQIMYQVHDFRPANVDRWARKKLDLAELVTEPEAARGQLFQLHGRVTLVESRRPLPELALQYELEKYYRCEFVSDDRQPVIVFTRTIPKEWKVGEAVDYRAGAAGLFLKFAAEREGEAPAEPPQHFEPVFLAPRIAWYPNTALGNLGMDVGLLDEVENDKGLTGRDRECFYQMLAAVGRAKPGQLLREAGKELKRLCEAEAEEELKQADNKLTRIDAGGKVHFSVVPLFNEPEKQGGRLMVLSGIARRVEKVRVGDENIRARFGIDHYYQISIFTEDSQRNPVVFCVRELPEGMPLTEDMSYRQRVRIAGFYFKKWAYPIGTASREPRDPLRKQAAPLLIGRKPIWYERKDAEQPISTVAGAIAGGLFIVALLGIWIAIWRYSRGDRQFRKETIAKTLAADPGISLNEIGLDADGKPDFNGLEGMDRAK